jgi:hypothetical protein
MFSWATFIHVVMCTYTSDLTIPCEYKACFIYSVRYRVVSYLTVVMDAILNHAQASPWVPVFNSLGIITRCGSAGSYGSFCVWIFNNRQVFSYGGWHQLTFSLAMWLAFLFLLIPPSVVWMCPPKSVLLLRQCWDLQEVSREVQETCAYMSR